MDTEKMPDGKAERKIVIWICIASVLCIMVSGFAAHLLSDRKDKKDRSRQDVVENMYSRIAGDPDATFVVDPEAFPVEGEEGDDVHYGGDDALSYPSDCVIDSLQETDGKDIDNHTAVSSMESRETISSPELWEETYPESDSSTSKVGQYTLTSCGTIQIPSISCALPLWEGAGKVEMRYGAGHMPYSVLPGENGNCVIYGHRMRAYGSMFNRLGEVKPGDVIRLSSEQASYSYVVDQIEVIPPSQISRYINAEDAVPRVTLITCTPTGVATHRLIVIGHLQL